MSSVVGSVIWGHTNVVSKWHLISSNDFSSVLECDKLRDGQVSGDLSFIGI